MALACVLAACAGSVSAFGARGGASVGIARKRVSYLAQRTAPISMSVHTPIEMISALVAVAGDVSDDFDVNSLPSPIQSLLLSPIVLAVPIGVGMTVAGAIILFLLWSMGGI
jgi:hypothetical protein